MALSKDRLDEILLAIVREEIKDEFTGCSVQEAEEHIKGIMSDIIPQLFSAMNITNEELVEVFLYCLPEDIKPVFDQALANIKATQSS